MRFAADRMLGKLAKWLRFLGYDTTYCNDLSDDEFLAQVDEGRILLTRNTRLKRHVAQGKLVFIKDNDPKIQLQELVRGLGLRPEPDRFFTRCAVCNEVLEPTEGADVYGRVPDYIWTAHDRFFRCRGCGKLYWEGTHLERNRKEIKRVLGKKEGA
jgi:uncharacterized protein with PIN domain